MNFDKIVVTDEINSCMKMFIIQSKMKGIKLELNIQSEIPQEFVTDKKRLRQVMINLLGNAFKYTEKGSIKVNIQDKV